MSQTKNALAALGAAVAALPGLSALSAASTAPTETTFELRSSGYHEDNAPANRVYYPGPIPVVDRYDIWVQQLAFSRPIGSRKSLSINSSFEYMSGASPRITTEVEGEPDKAKLYMSGASIVEKRFDLYSTLRQYFDKGDMALTLGGSIENDYRAVASGVDGALEVFDKLTVLNGGISWAYDALDPTPLDESDMSNPTTPGRVAARDQSKTQLSVYEGLTQILSPTTMFRAGVSYTHKVGYLSDPYRETPIAASTGEFPLYDIRPDQRGQWTVNLGWRHYQQRWDSALHADYRLFWDNWGVLSNSVELQWHKRIYADSEKDSGFFHWLMSNDFSASFAPKLRYYQQTAAYFYELAPDPDSNPDYYLTANHYFSSDARLSQYGSLNIGLESHFTWNMWTLTLNTGRYVSNPTLGFNTDEVPGLPSHWLWSVGLERRW